MIRKDKIVTFRIESILDEKLEQIANRNGLSRAEQYREAVKYFIVLRETLNQKI